MSLDLVTFGETMARLENPAVGPMRHARSLDLGIGGAESNTAIGLSRLGGSAAWFGRVGDDEFGRLITTVLAGEGVRLGHTVVDGTAPTALLFKERRSGTLTRVQYYRTGSAGSRLRPSDVPHDLIRTARVLHVTGITAAISDTARQALDDAVETARDAGVPVSLDLNYRSALWTPSEAGACLHTLVKRADLVFATEQEARLVVPGDDPGALATALAALGPRDVLVKRGAAGVVAFCEGRLHVRPAHRVPVVDPVGAGDAFAAGYLAEFVRGLPVAARLATATATGAYAVTVRGDWEGLPGRADLELLRTTENDVTR
ncbi:sugar kinase [Actinomadura citrea]|jgi:2-dehydro-3-deoxygluconokinase|uniref:2-dehydro-3-deoxygluconokinase n=1 Tax=Actinomadura citrea TaxID=46158 RepID=A0A7Y9G4W3_9ACTN|nr:sugar kinase [Actinomadura citrea]NYE10035.1 2-dehydro-3-deoxygluconokinase [Actinomadura citrea]GGT69514.1 sugar kinase [Actinomadura citrea]